MDDCGLTPVEGSLSKNAVVSGIQSGGLIAVNESPLLKLSAGSGGVEFCALIDSGASHNFISRSTAQQSDWKVECCEPLSVRLADGKVISSLGQVQGLTRIGQWTGLVQYQVLDLHFDAVLGMPWLKQVNPTIDWLQRVVTVLVNGCEVSLPVCHTIPSGTTSEGESVGQTKYISRWSTSRGGLGLTSGVPWHASALLPTNGHDGSTRQLLAEPDLQSSLQESHVGGLNMQCNGSMVQVQSAAKFARSLKADDTMFLCSLEQLSGDLAFTHRSAHGDCGVGKQKDSRSEQMLDQLEQQFPKVFETPNYPITEGRVPFMIPLIDPAKAPAKRRLYPLSEQESVELKKQLTELLDSGRIVPSASPYGHPILFARKKGGAGLRMCVDYRTLNSNTVTDAWPLPRIDELLSRLKGATIFSKLDLQDAYNQIPVSEADQYKTAFSCRYGNFQYRVLTYGFKNAPAHFQRTMNMLFHDMLDEHVLVYLDDILIFSKSREEHEEHVRKVFERLQQYDFHIKRKKCDLFLDKVEFLGHQVSADGIEVTPEKVAAVKAWPVPTTVRHIQQFLGLCNYFRRFIPKFAKVAQPMTDLTRKDIPFVWSDECQRSFEHLKQCLLEAPVLAVYDPDLPTELWCDASSFACGAVLVQQHGKHWRPVEYMSKRLSDAEMNYNVTEREFVGMLQGLRTWRHYLVGKRTTVRTDHASLQYLLTQPQLSRRQARWLEFLGQFDLHIVHVPGLLHKVPDALSRRPDMELVGYASATLVEVSDGLLAEIRSAQMQATDEHWLQLKTKATTGEEPYVVHDGLVCRRRGPNEYSIVVPTTELQDKLVGHYHDTAMGGHLGTYRLVKVLSERYYWRGLHASVRKYVKHCAICQQAKVDTRAQLGQLHPLPTPAHVFESVSMDLITHLPKTSRGFDSIATFVDRLSKYTYFVPCVSTITAEELAYLFMSTVVARHGMPSSLVSDRDPRFTSHFWKALVTLMGCTHSLSSAYHPQSDGQTERMHRSVEQVLRCLVSPSQTNWDDLLPAAEFALNSSPSASTGFSPAQVVFGRNPTFPLEQAIRKVVDCNVPSVGQRVQLMHDIVSKVRAAVSDNAARMKQSVDTHRRECTIEVGSSVWLSTRNLTLPPALSRKLVMRWTGPFPVVERINPVAFRLQLPATWRIHPVFHSSQLKPVTGDVHTSPSFQPGPDESGEFEVEDILDVRTVGRTRQYLVKWLGYGVHHATWEPRQNLTNCPDILTSFHQRRGLR